MEEVEDVFRGHGAGGLEFAPFLAEDELAVGVEDGDCWDAPIERDIVFLGDVEILVHFADVHVDDEEGPVKGGSDFRAVEGFVENVAVVAPVAAEDEEDALVGGRGGVDDLRDLGLGVDGGIDFLVGNGLEQAAGGAASDEHELPGVASVEPALDDGNIIFLWGGLKRECELHGKDV
jgi:hypothetical protein